MVNRDDHGQHGEDVVGPEDERPGLPEDGDHRVGHRSGRPASVSVVRERASALASPAGRRADARATA